jgi:hypothetical protein
MKCTGIENFNGKFEFEKAPRNHSEHSGIATIIITTTRWDGHGVKCRSRCDIESIDYIID